MTGRFVIVDIDGTVAMRNARDPYDMTTVMDDAPNYKIIELVIDLAVAGTGIIFVSGRDYSAEKATRAWIKTHIGLEEYDYHLFMRGIGDNRPDDQIKLTIWEDCIKDNFDEIRFVLDDRSNVVAMWRKLGLTCLQVADGNF